MITRRNLLGLVGASTLLAACPTGGTLPDGGSSSGFVTTAGNIITHLDQVLGGLNVATLPSFVGTAVSVARAACGVALSTLSLFSQGDIGCRDIGGVVSNAIRATLGVLDALARAAVAIPAVLTIAAAGAATIVDQVVGFICGPAVDAGATRALDASLTTAGLHAQYSARGLSYPVVPATLQAAPLR